MECAAVLDLSKNYFELFDLPVGFAVDAKRLAERYRALQAATHPDRLAREAERDARGPLQASSRINLAYRTLTDPLARAEYLLALHSGEEGWDAAGGLDGTFLMERLELGAILAEAQWHPNAGAAVARVLTQLAERRLILDKELEGLFSAPTAENLEAAREILRKLRLIDRCRRDAESMECSLERRT